MSNSHRTHYMTPEDFDKPYALRYFMKGRKNVGVYKKCETCVAASRHGIYNRAAYKRNDDYFCNIFRS